LHSEAEYFIGIIRTIREGEDKMIRRIGILTLLFTLLIPAFLLAQEGQATTSADTNKADMEPALEPVSDITVETAVCTSVVDRDPVGTADVFPAEVGQVYFWNKIEGVRDTTMIKHVWYFKGDEIATVQLPVRSSMWRTYSYKTIPPEWSGDWVVKVVDASGNVLKAVPFKVGEEKATGTE